MKYFLGLLVVILVLGAASARPKSADFRERVRLALETKGISLDNVLSKQDFVKKVGDIWSDCGGAGDIGKIGTVTITPDPPQKGQNLSIDADITLSEKVDNGSIALKLQYYVLGLPVTVIDETINICGPDTGLTCPLDQGDNNVKFAQEVPSSAPGGKYTGNAVATSVNGKQIICIDLEFNL